MVAAGWISDVKVRVAVVPRWAVYLLTLILFFGGRWLVAYRVPSIGLLALLVIDTALIWYLLWQLPPGTAPEKRQAR
jgi:hypothetical protein